MYILEYNGFTLQNDDNHTINKLNGLSRVDVRVFEDDTTGADGGNIWERRYGMRTIVVGGSIFSDTLEEYFDLREAFTNAFILNPSDYLLKITRPDGGIRYIYAKVVDVPLFQETEGEFAEAVFEVVLRCEDPFFTDGVVSEVEISPGIEGGTPVPMPIPSPIGGVGETATIINSGDSDIIHYAEFDILGQITNATVTNQTSGLSFAVNTTILLGETVNLYIQNNDLYVRLGTSNYYTYFAGTFFPIIEGNNVIAFNGSSFDANARLRIRFQNRYLGIS